MSNGADFNKDEKLMARRDGAKLIKNSGRGETKGDAKKGNLLIDYKFTDKASFALNNAEFEKLGSDAFKAGLEPVIVVVFDSTKRRAIMDWNYVLELENQISDLKADIEDLDHECAYYREELNDWRDRVADLQDRLYGAVDAGG